MKQLFLQILIGATLFLPSVVQAFCEDCPFPLVLFQRTWVLEDDSHWNFDFYLGTTKDRVSKVMIVISDPQSGEVIAYSTTSHKHDNSILEGHFVFYKGEEKTISFKYDFNHGCLLILQNTREVRLLGWDSATRLLPKKF